MRLPLSLLALVDTDFASIGMWLLGICVTVVIVVERVLRIIEFFKTKPAAHETYASKAELADVKREHEVLKTGFETMVERITEALKADLTEHKKETRELSKSLEAIQRSIGQIEGQLKGQRRNNN